MMKKIKLKVASLGRGCKVIVDDKTLTNCYRFELIADVHQATKLNIYTYAQEQTIEGYFIHKDEKIYTELQVKTVIEELLYTELVEQILIKLSEK